MINLDDKETVLKLQGGDAVVRSVDAFPKQVETAWREAQKITTPPEYKNVSSILVCGMGGSRFPALIIKELFKENLTVPLEIQDEYQIPKWAGENTLVILSSYSGTTEEVTYAGAALKNQGVKKIFGITTGGDVAEICRKNNFPLYRFDPVDNPSGQPRIGLGYTVGGLLGILYSLRLIEVHTDEIEKAIAAVAELTQNWKTDVSAEKNQAKQIASKIFGRIPYYIVAEHLRGCGNAIANQTNETAKSISDFRIIPELNHHLMEGLKFPNELKKLALFIFFNSSLYAQRIKKRFAITKDVVEQNKIETLWIELQGKTKPEQALELLALGGYITMYLSTLYEENPNVIPYVDYFKKKMKE